MSEKAKHLQPLPFEDGMTTLNVAKQRSVTRKHKLQSSCMSCSKCKLFRTSRKYLFKAMRQAAVFFTRRGTCAVAITTCVVVSCIFLLLGTSPLESIEMYRERRRGAVWTEKLLFEEIRKVFQIDSAQKAHKKETETRRQLIDPRKLARVKENKPVFLHFRPNGTYVSPVEDLNQLGLPELKLKKKQAVLFPTSDAPKFKNDLEKRWDIPNLFLLPWKVQWLFRKYKLRLDECFRPPKPRNRWSMIILVKSWVVNWEIRNTIRKTWSTVAGLGGSRIKVVFLLAKPTSDARQEKVNDESRNNGDILQINVEETTQHFTGRTLSGMTWVTSNIPPHYLYASVDDNMMLNVDRVIESITDVVREVPDVTGGECTPKQVFPLVCGFSLREKDTPTRNMDSPWAISKEDYPPNIFPRHCQGGFYVTSVSTLNLLLEVATRTYSTHLDAVWVTGILRQKLGLGPESVRLAKHSAGPLVQYLERDIAENIKKLWGNMTKTLRRKNVILMKRTQL